MNIIPTFVKNVLRRFPSVGAAQTSNVAAADVFQTSSNPAGDTSSSAPQHARAMLVPPNTVKRGSRSARDVWAQTRSACLAALSVADKPAQALLLRRRFVDVQRRVRTLCKGADSPPLDTALHALIAAARDLPTQTLSPLYYDVFQPLLCELGDVTPDEFAAMDRFQRNFELIERPDFRDVEVGGKPLSYEDSMYGVEKYGATNLASQIFGWVYLAEKRNGSQGAADDDQVHQRATKRCLELSQEQWGKFSADDFLAGFGALDHD